MEQIHGDPARQAISSLQGYVYQIYASALAWVSLAEDELLFLEVAEDYAVATKNALKGVQVKNTSTSITINSEDVLDSINSFFDLKVRNPDKNISFKHLTTSKIGKEKKKTDQILNQACLLYWSDAARSDDLEPLRERLLKLGLSTAARKFIGDSSDYEFREHFLKQFEWIAGTTDLESLRKQLSDRLVLIGERKGVPSSVCDKLVDLLVSKIFAEIVSSNTRVMNRPDFLRFFDDNSRTNVPHDLLDGLIRNTLQPNSTENSIELVKSNIVLSNFSRSSNSGFLPRAELFAQISSSVEELGIAWIYGGAGYGKTSLAEDYTRQKDETWKVLFLRGHSSSQTATMLYNASAQLAVDRPNGLLLDDLDHNSTGVVKNAISQFISTAFQFGTKVIVTSNSPISSNAANTLGLNDLTPVHATDFTEQEVGELIENLDGPKEFWKKYVHLVSSAGHPQLVHALCVWLHDKGWPKSELHSLDALLGKNDAIEQTRQEVRLRIVEELPKDRRRLLLRLSLVSSQFERSLAIALGDVSPALDEAGTELDKLIGAWVEAASEGQFRTSSLVTNAGSKTLSKIEQRSVHHQIASEYIKLRTIDANKIDELHMHALLGENQEALAACAYATIVYSAKDLPELANVTLVPKNFPTDRLIYPKHIATSRILRIQQILLAAASLDKDKFESAFSAYKRELQEIDDQKSHAGAKAVIEMKLLMQDNLINVVENFPMFVTGIQEYSGELDFSIPEMDSQIWGKVSSVSEYLQFMFAYQINQITDFSLLQKMFRQLHELTDSQVEFLKNAFSDSKFEEPLIVKAPWLHAIRNNEKITEKFALDYVSLGKKLADWGDIKFAVACFETASVIWDEDLKNSEKGLEVLSEALQIFGNQDSLIRAKSRVLFHQNRYAEQIEEASAILDNFSGGNIEGAYFYREIAIAHSHLEKHQVSAEFYARGRELASKVENSDMRIMEIGFMADEAVEHHYRGTNSEAIELLAKTLKLVWDIDPGSSLRAAAIHRLVPHTITWLLTRVSDLMQNLDPSSHQMVPGANSNPTPHRDFENDQPRPLEYVWYILADVESELDLNLGVKEFLFSEEANHLAVLTSELISLPTAMRSAFRMCHVSKFGKLLARSLDAYVYVEVNASELKKSDIFKPSYGRVPELSVVDFSHHRGRLVRKALGFLLHICFSKNSEEAYSFLKSMKNANRSILSEEFQQSILGAEISTDGSDASLCGIVGFILESNKSGEQVAAPEMLIVSLRLLEIIRDDSLHLVLAPKALTWLKDQWSLILDKQAFNIRNPVLSKQLFLEAIERNLQGCEGIADLILSLSSAVKLNLGAAYIRELEAIRNSE